MAAEDQKPSEKRLREYRDSARNSLELQLFSTAPVYADLEQAKFAEELSLYAGRWGGDDPIVVKLLGGKSPRERAAELISGSKLNDVNVRKQLAEGGAKAIEASKDPLVQLFCSIESDYRKVRETDDELDEVQRQAY